MALAVMLVFLMFDNIFMPRVAHAGGAIQIRDAKLKWVTTDYDGIPERLLLKKEYDNGDTFSVQYQMDIVLTGAEAHEPGSIRITAPKQIFHQRSSRPDGSVQTEGYGNMTFPVPSTPTDGISWHWEDTGDGRYVIVNDVTIDAAASLMFQCTITGLQPNRLVDMLPSDPLKVTVEVTAKDGMKDTMDTQELTAVIDTKAALTTYGTTPGASLTGTVYNTPENISPSVLENLPGGAETANGFVFVCWKTQPYYEAAQYFRLEMDLWAGEAAGNGTMIPGIILGRTAGGGTVTTQDSGAQAGQHYSRTVTTYDWDDRGTRNGNRAQDIWVAYPTAQMQANETYTISAAATWTMTESDPERGSDPQEVTAKSVDATVNYLHSEWEFPEGSFGVYKYTDSHPSHTHTTPAKDVPDGSTNSYHKKNHTYSTAIGALRNNQPVTIEYEVLTTGYGYAYTAGPTGEVPDLPEGWEYNPAHYLNWNYLMETTDDTLTIQNVAGALQAGDYCITGITVATPEMFTYGYLQPSQSQYMLPGSTFGYKPDSSLPKPDVEVWVKDASGQWTLLETVSLKSGTKTITFPDGVIGYKTRVMTNQAACKVAVWPTVQLLPSNHLMDVVETVLQGYTNVVVDNDAGLKTTYYYSATRPDEVQPSQEAWLEAAAADGHTQETSDSSSATLAVAGFSVYGNTGIAPDPPENDTVNRRIKASMYMYADEKSNLSSRAEYDAAVVAGAVIPETSGTWYLLLPENMTPDMSSVSLRSGDRIIEKEAYDNFRGTGRTLLVVRGTLSPNVTDSYSGANRYFTDRIFLSLDAYMPWEDYADLEGNKYVDYYAAFESGNPGTLGNLVQDRGYYQSIGYPDAWPSEAGTWLNGAPYKIKQAMTDLDPDTDEARFVYLYGSIGLGGIDIMEQVEFRKDVRAGSTGAWAKGTEGETQVTVTEGGNYTYRMTVAAKHDSYIGGIMFYDAVEEFAPTDIEEPGLAAKKRWSGTWNEKGQWQGTLVSVDMTELYAKGFGPQLYYTAQTGLQFGAQGSIDTTDTHGILQSFDGWNSDYNLFNSDLWKRVPDGAIVNGVWTVPEGTKVAAIAVDAQRGTNPATMCLLSPGDKVSVYLNMKAPTDGGDDSKWNAKGAYAHKTDNAASPDDIDWIAAADSANNMYAYNKAAAVYLRFSTPTTQASHGYARDRSVLDFEYTRVGIVPESIMVRKTWDDKGYASGVGYVDNYDGLRPDQVTVRLKGETGVENSPVITDTLILKADDNWQGIFQNAPETDSNGNRYTYTVTEDSVPGYTTSVYKEDNRSYEIVNKHTKEQVSIKIDKLWLNPDGTAAEAPDGAQPIIVLTRIGSDGKKTDFPHTYTKNENWTYTFVMDRYEPGGFEYIYAVTGESNVPDGWFAQTNEVPLGVEVAEYDKNDIHTFRNFKKPDFGYLMVSAHVEDRSKPKDGNNTVLPSFPFTVEMEYDGADLSGEYEYVIFDKSPVNYDSTELPTDAAVVSRGTIRAGGTITLKENQCFQIIGLPAGTVCSVNETVPKGWSIYSPWRVPVEKTIRVGKTEKIAFRNEYSAKSGITVTGTKKLRGREQQAGEFRFEMVDDNQYNDYGYDNFSYKDVVGTATTGQSRGTVTENGETVGLARFTINGSYDGYNNVEITEYGGTKTLTYLVREVIPSGAQTAADGTVTYKNVTYDTQIKQVTLTFTDNRDGTLKVTASTTEGDLVFTNVYGFEKKITLTAHKELVGRSLQPEEFSFEVRRADAAPDSEPLAIGKNDADGNITFSPDIILTERDLETISPQTGIGEITFLISEVQGTNPTVMYMTKPVEAKVQIALTENGELLVAMPGQTLKPGEEDCMACGGSGTGGIAAVTMDASMGKVTEIYMLSDCLDGEIMKSCPNCRGTGLDPAGTGDPCGTCKGAGFTFAPCTHPNQTGAICPDCIGILGAPAIHRDGMVIGPVLPGFTLSELCEMTYVPEDQCPSCITPGVYAGYVFTEEEWATIQENPNALYNYLHRIAAIYPARTEDPCSVCGGTGKVDGELVVDGEAEPVQLVNYLKPEVSITATKTFEGKPATEKYTFGLYESNENGYTTKLIETVENKPDGTITFSTMWLDPTVTEPYYFVVRELSDGDDTIEYDSHEALYVVTFTENEDGLFTPDIKTIGDTEFRNGYKDGSLAVEITMDGPVPEGNQPVFPVEIVIKDRDGKPMANATFIVTEETKRRALRAAGSGNVLTTDSEGRATLQVPGGKTLIVSGLPHGATFEVSQVSGSMPEGFAQSTAEGTKGTVKGGTQSRTTFGNTYTAPKTEVTPEVTPETTPEVTPELTPVPNDSPKTTDTLPYNYLIVLLVVCLGAMVALRVWGLHISNAGRGKK